MEPSVSPGMAQHRPEPREVLLELLDDWGGFSSVDTFHQPAARRDKTVVPHDVARISVIIGLANHVYETAQAAMLLIDNSHTNAAIPLVRLAYENALMAVWLVQSKDQHGITAFINEYGRGRRALQQDAVNAASKVFRESAEYISDTDPTTHPETSDSTKYFRQICFDIDPGGADAYILYRILSGYSHASVPIADLYIDKGPKGTPRKRSHATEALGPDLLIYLLACSLVWGGRAFTYLSRDRAHRSALRNAGRDLGINAEPQLSAAYYARHAKRPQSD